MKSATARRNTFGAKARPATVEGASKLRFSPLPVMTCATLPADQATARSGPSATWSIQRFFSSVASAIVWPCASVAMSLPSSPPVTMRSPSDALTRMPPPCTATLRSPSANSSVSSPSTNTGTCPRKCTPTTCASVAMVRTRSASEGMAVSGMLMRGRALRHAAGEAFADLLFRHFAADEDDAGEPLLALFPRTLMIAVEEHVHALEDEALWIVLEREDALAAQDVRAFLLHQLLHPREDLVGVYGLFTPERHALHVFVVIVLESRTLTMVMITMAMMMPVIVMMIVVVVMMMPVVVVVLVGLEALRLDVEDAVEVEGVAAEHDVDLHVRA